MKIIKSCKCGCEITDRSAIKLTSDELGVWLTCPSCKTTGILKGQRLAKCYCGGDKYHKCHDTVSNDKLPFFKSKKDQLTDEYYCGAFGWD